LCWETEMLRFLTHKLKSQSLNEDQQEEFENKVRKLFPKFLKIFFLNQGKLRKVKGVSSEF